LIYEIEETEKALTQLKEFIIKHVIPKTEDEKDRSYLKEMRSMNFTIARIFISILLIDQAVSSDFSRIDLFIAQFWLKFHSPLSLLSDSNEFNHEYQQERVVALNLNDQNVPNGCGNIDQFGKPRSRM